jgi:carbon monoxide dehydrogenase subunit G
MASITRSIEVHAPADRAFEHLSDPGHLIEIWPSLLAVSKAEQGPDGAHHFDWTYRMAGVKFHGHCDTVDVEPGRRRVDRNEGGIPSTFRWTFEPRGEASEVRLEVEYDPPTLLELVAGPLLRTLNEREAETLLSNLKAKLEAAPPLTRG